MCDYNDVTFGTAVYKGRGVWLKEISLPRVEKRR